MKMSLFSEFLAVMRSSDTWVESICLFYFTVKYPMYLLLEIIVVFASLYSSYEVFALFCVSITSISITYLTPVYTGGFSHSDACD